MIIVIIMYMAIMLTAINPAKQFFTVEKDAQQSQIQKGKFQDFTGKEHTYDSMYNRASHEYVVSFQPSLKNDDRIVVQAIQDIIAMYGENSLIDPTPILEARSGIDLTKFKGDSGYYYVLPIDEETGEIHKLTFWKE